MLTNFTYFCLVISMKWCSQIWESKEQKLGVIIGRGMKFDEYILIKCKKVGRKLSALGRVCKFLNLEHWRSLMKAFIES